MSVKETLRGGKGKTYLHSAICNIPYDGIKGATARLRYGEENKLAELDHQDGLVRFDAFEANLETGELFKAGRKLKFGGQPFQLLAILLERPGEVVTRDELQKRLWPDTFVDVDRNLNTSINRIRDVLSDSAETPRYVETMPRRGYRFIGSVQKDNVEEAPKSEANLTSRFRFGKINAPVLVGAALLIAALAFIGWRITAGHLVHSSRTQPRLNQSASANMRMVTLTRLSGEVWGPTFSPDGEKVAFFWDGEGIAHRSDLYVQLVGADKPLRLTNTTDGSICCADWSPDGQRIAFSRCGDYRGAVFVIPALGGPERKVADLACLLAGFDGGEFKWTADGRSLIIMDQCTPDAPVGIVVFSLQTGQKRCLDSPRPGESGDFGPAVSPDQKSVVFVRARTYSISDLYTVDLSGGNLRRLTFDNERVSEPMWASDGQRLVFYSGRRGGRLWEVPAGGGTIEPETVFPATGALSRDGHRFAYVQFAVAAPAAVWRLKLSRVGGESVSQNQIIASSGNSGAAELSPDERQIAFESERSGTVEIWKSQWDGSDPQQLTSFNVIVGTPRWSPDGKLIAFDADRLASHSQIYLMDADGRNQHSIVSGEYDNVVPRWARDGKSIYFASNRSGDWQVWNYRLSDRAERQVTRGGGWAAMESDDGKTLYFSRKGGGLWATPVGGGEEKFITGQLHAHAEADFAVISTGIYLLNAKAAHGAAIMYYNFSTSRLTSVYALKENADGGNSSLTSSRDGLTLLLSQAPFPQSSITMVEGFQ